LSVPHVSVLVPLQDEAAFLAEALESLSAQTFTEVEALVVDERRRDSVDFVAVA
jgi:glycosyltransferase involved in cell wall biosynthesis